MNKIAFYGKGGIGKSTIVSHIAVALAQKGLTVMQIGCDPKADSTSNLLEGKSITTVLDLVRSRNDDFTLEEMLHQGYAGVLCVEAGGPVPGLGCAGRGIIAALEKLRSKGALTHYKPDVVLYDVLGDVVCGGFSMPMRKGYAQNVFIITSGENMSIHAAANIAMALDNFKGRGYASLGGLILNRRNVRNEDAKVRELADDFHTSITGTIDWNPVVQEADELHQTVLEAFPEDPMAVQYRALADAVLARAKESASC